ncbi:hypothetical protein C1752_08641 [Acaryochloris thomasi RCC1774]|uniref:Uncharacterized protein n=1 Tax=Acaryochloris thomasi RCC1774 TaxID=1764569 RepID=A0A2W1JIV2_9CYAN|nr:hypothetical protein [Acaryochloris thomasi]PZD70982.1 hypothetical protein C1752_08641 [Acaryochloris thomasi RCC1774]
MPAEVVTYTFQGLEGTPSTCQLTIYRRPNFDVVIVENSEAEDETLAIKRIEAIVTGATDTYQLDPDRTTWLSCTPEPLDLLGAFRKIPIEWAKDGFTLPKPGTPWSYLSRAEVEEMIGESPG